MTDKKIGIIGATGYAGAELVRLLVDHPYVNIEALSSVSFEGKNLRDIYPMFNKVVDIQLVNEDEVIDSCDIIFASVPHGISEEIAKKCMEKDKIFIDLGADFRLVNEDDYKDWYKGAYNEPELHKLAVYGLPELYRDQIENAKIIANPGCYPTTVALGLFPALSENLIDTKTIIIDAKSGVTGAGRGLTQNTHYPECNENFAPYKIAEHRHTPEIEQTLSNITGEKITVTFVPHLLPINRGIESTIYANLNTDISLEDIHALYTDYYLTENFIRVLPIGQVAAIKNVRLSNFCDISIHKDSRTNRLIIVSCIDNMVKGAAGQAIQNMNIILELPEFTGLSFITPAF